MPRRGIELNQRRFRAARRWSSWRRRPFGRDGRGSRTAARSASKRHGRAPATGGTGQAGAGKAATTTAYGFGKTVACSFETAVAKVTEALQQEGFGVLTDIDAAATIKKKLDRDMPPYRILGACNPSLAHRALTAEPAIGLSLPCNVVVRQDETGAVRVEFLDPIAVLRLVDNPAVAELAGEVEKRLERVLEAL